MIDLSRSLPLADEPRGPRPDPGASRPLQRAPSRFLSTMLLRLLRPALLRPPAMPVGVAAAARRPLAQAARRPAALSLGAGAAAWALGWSAAALADGDKQPAAETKEAAAAADEEEVNPMTGESGSKLPDPDNTEEIEEALNCPCIDGMKEGPCGDTFVAAYRCFLESKAEERGSDCLDQFQGMQACFVEHADYYEKKDEDAKAAEAAEDTPEWEKRLADEKKKSGVWA